MNKLNNMHKDFQALESSVLSRVNNAKISYNPHNNTEPKSIDILERICHSNWTYEFDETDREILKQTEPQGYYVSIRFEYNVLTIENPDNQWRRKEVIKSINTMLIGSDTMHVLTRAKEYLDQVQNLHPTKLRRSSR